MSDQTTLRSAMTVQSIILVCRALLSSSVLWRTLCWELTVDMILQKETNKILPRIIQKYTCLVSKKIWQSNSSTKDYFKK
jgi:hypothetical protein